MSRPRLAALLLVLVTLAVYLPVTRHDFVCYDDDSYIVANRIVQNGLTPAGIGWAFTTGYMSNWHPVTWISHMTDCEFFGLNAGGHHLVSAAFHSANTVLLFFLLLRLTKKNGPAALVAALFAWHPLHVESVAWIAERKDVLSTFFALLTLVCYTRFAHEKSRRDYWLALFLFALGLMAKPMLVTLPFVLLLLDYWPLGRFSISNFQFPILRKLVLEKIPFFLLAVASCLITFLVQRKAESSLEEVPLAFRWENASSAAVGYLLKLFWPAGLAVIYPLAPISGANFALAVVVLLLISAAAWRGRSHCPYVLMGWAWFLGTLVPVIGLVQVGSAAMADRYTYIPSIGLFIATVFGLHALSERFRWPGRVFPALATIVCGLCLGLTERQISYWSNSETLFRHALAVTKNNDIAHDNLGVALESQGRYQEALAEYREAVRLNPGHYQLNFVIGNMLEKTGRPEAALAAYRQCLLRNPGVPALHEAAGHALAALGSTEAALKEFAEAERLDAHYALPRIDTAKIYFQQGRDAGAVDELWAAARAEPYNPDVLSTVAHYLAANQDAAARDGQNALVLALKANELSRNHQPAVFDVLGMAFAETGDFSNAVTCAQNALDLAGTSGLEDPGFFRQRLELYKTRQPWRESFRATNAPANR